MNVQLLLSIESAPNSFTDFSNYVMRSGADNLTYKIEDAGGDAYVPQFGVKLSSMNMGDYFKTLRIARLKALVAGEQIFDGRIQEHGIEIDVDDETTTIKCSAEDKHIIEALKEIKLDETELGITPGTIAIPSGTSGNTIVMVDRQFTNLATLLGTVFTLCEIPHVIPSLVSQYFLGGIKATEPADKSRFPRMNGYELLQEVCNAFRILWWWDGTTLRLARKKDLLAIAPAAIDVDYILDTQKVKSSSVDQVRMTMSGTGPFNADSISRLADVGARQIPVSSKFVPTEKVFLFPPWNDYSRATITANAAESAAYLIRIPESSQTMYRKVSASDLLNNNWNIELLRTYDLETSISLQDGPHPLVFANIYQRVNRGADVLWVTEATINLHGEAAEIVASGYDLESMPEETDDDNNADDNNPQVVSTNRTVSVDDDFTVEDGLDYVLVTTGNSNKEIEIITLAEVTIVKMDGGTGSVVIAGTVNGMSDFAIGHQYGYVKLRRIGDDAFVVVAQG